MQEEFGKDASFIYHTANFPKDDKNTYMRKIIELQKISKDDPFATHQENIQELNERIADGIIEFYDANHLEEVSQSIQQNETHLITTLGNKTGVVRLSTDNTPAAKKGILTYTLGSDNINTLTHYNNKVETYPAEYQVQLTEGASYESNPEEIASHQKGEHKQEVTLLKMKAITDQEDINTDGINSIDDVKTENDFQPPNVGNKSPEQGNEISAL